MTFERGTYEGVYSMGVDGLFDECALRGCQSIEPGSEAGPAARRGQLIEGRGLLRFGFDSAGALRRVGECSRFISWFKDGSGDRGVTPLGRSCHPVTLRLVTSFGAAG
ncbi:hypothetical protein [Rhodococcus sp. R1101]|uniref:hypothetical protein n=1 Tax=Rhodococcus sp. R1101 TaxID=1170698 RepID=UPI00036C9BF8|nr:hypothetical protein [Rhodococcus sp. R1101]